MDEEPVFNPARLNLTELVQLCTQVNPEAHRRLPRALLERIALGEDVELPQYAINKTRLKIMSYINENFSQVEYQISCPARSRSPFACFSCSDTQVACCTLSNVKLLGKE